MQLAIKINDRTITCEYIQDGVRNRYTFWDRQQALQWLGSFMSKDMACQDINYHYSEEFAKCQSQDATIMNFQAKDYILTKAYQLDDKRIIVIGQVLE